jgi:hypothetical protein
MSLAHDRSVDQSSTLSALELCPLTWGQPGTRMVSADLLPPTSNCVSDPSRDIINIGPAAVSLLVRLDTGQTSTGGLDPAAPENM